MSAKSLQSAAQGGLTMEHGQTCFLSRGEEVKRLAGLGALVVIAASVLGASETFAAETVQCANLRGGGTPPSISCQIHEPNVREKSEFFPQIVLHGGNRVYFTAHGCAQTGGHGKTWKRYLNPSGDESGKYYHGLISIPGVTNGLEQMSKYNAKYLMIPNSVGNVPLELGYSDENGGYGDNGYWGHDDGTDDQCKNVENAWIQIEVDRLSP
jgi:hypothetical protein